MCLQKMSGQTADAYHRDISRRLLRADNTLTLSLLHVVLGSASIATCVLLAGSWMDSVQVHLGLDHYAESLSPLSTTWLPMPFNAVVNVGYVAVGVFWILHVRNNAAWMMRADEAYLMYVLAWMLVLYGPVQLVRILSHWRRLEFWTSGSLCPFLPGSELLATRLEDVSAVVSRMMDLTSVELS